MITLNGSNIEIKNAVLYGHPFLKNCIVNGKAVEIGTGTKSPNNLYALTGTTKVTASDGATPHDYVLSQTLYGLPDGKHDTFEMVAGTGTRVTGKVVITGTESVAYFHRSTTDSCDFTLLISVKGKVNSQNVVCDQFENQTTQMGVWGTDGGGNMYFVRVPNTYTGIVSTDTDAQAKVKIKAWLASKYAAGGPITVLYELATPQTITATPQQIQTLYPYTRITNDVGADMTVSYMPIQEANGIFDMLPPYHKNSNEIMDLQNAFNTQIEQIQDTKDDLMLQLNVETATWGLALWEKGLAIKTDVSKQIEFRRSRIESKLRSQGVTTKSMIKNVAESFSNGVVDVDEHAAEYRFDVKFTGTIGIPPNMDDLTAAIEEIKPAHLAYTYIYTYMTHNQLKQYTHAQLASFTHAQIRNGEGT